MIPLLKFIKNHQLAAIILFGLVFRIIYGFTTFHIYFADELYQVLEPGFAMANGYGIIPWEFQHGMRSLLIPSFISLVLQLLSKLSIDEPNHYIPIINVICSIVSIAVIPSVYMITKALTKRKVIALTSALISAFWYELVYLSSKPLSDIIGVYCLISALALTLTSLSTKYQIFSAILFALGIYIRYPLIIFLPLFLHLIIRTYPPAAQIIFSLKQLIRTFLPFIVTAISTGIILGTYDYLTLGNFASSVVMHFQINATGVSQLFGFQAWWYYLIGILVATSGLILFLKFLPPKYHYIRNHLLLIVTYFSFIPHKEYRFILLTIPFIIILITITMDQWLQKKKYTQSIRIWIILTALITVTLLMITNITAWLSKRISIPYSYYPFQQLFFKRDQLLEYYSTQLNQDHTVCGIYDFTRPWEGTGGYFYLGKDIPIYDKAYPPADFNYVNIIITFSTLDQIKDFELIDTIDYQDEVGENTLAVFWRHPPCLKDPEYGYNRNIPEVETYLKQYEKRSR